MAIPESEKTPYSQLDIHSLILICIDNVIRNKEDCTFERLVYECFTNFPKEFCLFRYPQWPDSNKLDRPLRKLRERGLIVGSPKIGFSITEDGKYQLARARRILEDQIRVRPAPRALKGKERNFVAYVKNSELYQRFIIDKSNFDLTEQEFIDLLRGTLETPKRVLRQNLAQFEKLAENLRDAELLEFIRTCKSKMKQLLE